MLKEIVGKEDERLLVSEGLKGKVGEYGQLINSYELAIKLAKEGKLKEALAVLEKENAKDYISKRTIYENNLKDIYLGSKGLETKYNFNQYNIKPELKEILNRLQMLMAKGEGKALLLTGPTGTGKTLSMLA
jgi:DNA replication protein DnaC